MAGEKKKGLFGKLFGRKEEDQETASREPGEVKKGASAAEPPQPEKAPKIPSEAPEEPSKDIPGSGVLSLGGSKTDIVELEMDIPEDEIPTVALSLDDLDTAALQSDVELDAPVPEQKDERSFADVQLETAEIETTTEIKLDDVTLETVVSLEAPTTEIPSHPATAGTPYASGQATIPITLQDVEANLAIDDQEVDDGLEIDIDLDEDEETPLPSPFQAGGVREEPPQAEAVPAEEASVAGGPASGEEPPSLEEDQEMVIEEDEEPDFEITTEEEQLPATSRDLAAQLGFAEHVAPNQSSLEPLVAAEQSEEPLSLQEVSAPGTGVDVPGPQGLGDTPLRHPDQIADTLGVQAQVAALAGFVMNCRTPLCISIQGEGGSGKTSLMSLTAAELDHTRVLTTWFSSRDYSRFSDTREVPALLIKRVLNTIERNVPQDKAGAIKQMTDEAVPLMNGLWKADSFLEARGVATIEIDASADALPANGESDAIAGLKLKLRETIHHGLEFGDKERIIVFVDDMDRVHPSMALDLLETISTFLTLEHCLFVVACGPDTIERGMRATSSSDSASDTPRSYFERVFQLSVNLPPRVFQLREFVTNLLASARFDTSERTLNDVLPLLQHSVGLNPRKMKRVANRLVYAGEISPELRSAGDVGQPPRYRTQKLLLALGCLDSEFGPVFRLLASKRHDDTKLMSLIDERLRDHGQIRTLAKEQGRLGGSLNTETGVDNLVAFMDLFSDLVHAGAHDTILDREGIQLLKQAIDLITVTSIERTHLYSEDAEQSALTEFCTRVGKRLNQILPNVAPDGSDKSIRSWPSARPWFGFWFTDEVARRAWGPRRLYYELSFDTANRNTVSVSLKCNTARLGDFGVDHEAVDRLKGLSALEDHGFRVKEYDSGWLEIVKVLHGCTCGNVDEVNDDEVDSVAREMKDLVQATRDVFDPRPQLKVLRHDIQRLVKRQIPPCKVCGSELKQVTTVDGSIGFRCEKCRKIYKPKTTKPEE